MSSRRLAPLLLVSLGCASSAPSTQRDARPTADQPAPTQEELSRAFDPEREPPGAQVARAPGPPPDPYARYADALSVGQSGLKGRDLAAAREAAATAVSEAERLDGDARFQAGQLAFNVAKAGGEAQAAIDAAVTWRKACGPDKADPCRSAALNALASIAKWKDAPRDLARGAALLKEAEACAAVAEKRRSPSPCEARALSVAEQHDDAFVVARVRLGQALREPDDGRQAALLQRAEKACALRQCEGLRRKALGRLIALAREKNDVDGALKWALREVAVVADGLPEPWRPYSRTPALDQACVSYDTAHGAGSCRAREKQELGAWSFHDFSKGPAGQGLSADQVRTVNDHYAPLLQECLSEQARRMTPPDAQRFEVRWLVFNDGRVGEAHLRKDLDASPLANCLRAQFVVWRYPRYEGELQHVQQSFTVTAVERRMMR